jgi:hypothetical protein
MTSAMKLALQVEDNPCSEGSLKLSRVEETDLEHWLDSIAYISSLSR